MLMRSQCAGRAQNKQNNGACRCLRVREGYGRVLSRSGGDRGCRGVAPGCAEPRGMEFESFGSAREVRNEGGTKNYSLEWCSVHEGI